MYEMSGIEAATRSRGSISANPRGEAHVANALTSSSLFALCSKKELRLIAKLAKQRSVPAGTTLMSEGERGDEMLVVLDGGLTVSRNGRKVASLGPGRVVGELGVLTKNERDATVVAASDSEVAVISRRALTRMIEDAPGFSRKLLEALANRVRELDKKCLD